MEITSLVASVAAAIAATFGVYANNRQADFAAGQLRVMKDQLNDVRDTAENSAIGEAMSVGRQRQLLGANKKLAEATKAQATASQVSAGALTKQLEIQRVSYENTYRAKLRITPVTVGGFNVRNGREVTYSVDAQIVNYGIIGAASVVYMADLVPLRDTNTRQDALCKQAERFQKLKTPDGVAVENGQTVDAQSRLPENAHIGGGALLERLRGPDGTFADILPAVVGCVAYKTALSDKTRFTRFLWVITRSVPGQSLDIPFDRPFIPANELYLQVWSLGNRED